MSARAAAQLAHIAQKKSFTFSTLLNRFAVVGTRTHVQHYLYTYPRARTLDFPHRIYFSCKKKETSPLSVFVEHAPKLPPPKRDGSNFLFIPHVYTSACAFFFFYYSPLQILNRCTFTHISKRNTPHHPCNICRKIRVHASSYTWSHAQSNEAFFMYLATR